MRFKLPMFERHQLGARSVKYEFMSYTHSYKVFFLRYYVFKHHFHIYRNVPYFYNRFMFHFLSHVINDIAIIFTIYIKLQSIKHYKPDSVFVIKYKQ